MDEEKLIKLKEGSLEFYIYQKDEDSIPSKSMGVFYNKKMELNRDISILAVNAYKELYNQVTLTIIDSMAASGIGSLRMVKECNDVKKIYINDINPVAIGLVNKNISLNKIDKNLIQIEVSRKDANMLFSEIAQESLIDPPENYEKPNIISIDPFGTPNLYVDSAFKTIKKANGLICITATDTAVLFGVRPKPCIRKYMAKPLNVEYGKEIGARILLYFISRIANINKVGIVPLLTFYSNHFVRVFALTYKNKKIINQSPYKYGYILHCLNCGYRKSIDINILGISKSCPSCGSDDKLDYAGPLWIDEIHDILFIQRILELNKYKVGQNWQNIEKLLNYAAEEINMPIFYYNLHKWCKLLKLSTIPKTNVILEAIKKKGFKATRTHFDFTSIKTTMKLEEVKQLLKELN